MNIFGHSLRFPETQGMVARRENSVNEGLSRGALPVGAPSLAPMGVGRLKQCRPYGFAYLCFSVRAGVDRDTRASRRR